MRHVKLPVAPSISDSAKYVMKKVYFSTAPQQDAVVVPVQAVVLIGAETIRATKYLNNGTASKI